MRNTKFIVGDRIVHKATGFRGEVVRIMSSVESPYVVRYDSEADAVWFVAESCIDFEDPRGAFLGRLSSLLQAFDARVRCVYHENTKSCYPCVNIGGEDLCWFTDEGITALNAIEFQIRLSKIDNETD